MIDSTQLERAAMRRCLRHFGEAAGEIGFDKALGNYSEAEALKVIDAIVSSYVDSMAARQGEHLGTPKHPFADMDDDIPWEGL
jgi:Family of unknown function (DUF6511)